jgi:DNA-binding XRE family transcriptional regulator
MTKLKDIRIEKQLTQQETARRLVASQATTPRRFCYKI